MPKPEKPTGQLVTLPENPITKPIEFEPILRTRMEDLNAALAGTDISPDRFIKAVIHSLARHPKVMACTPTSILLAVLEAAEMGLEPTGPYGGAHLVPYRNKSNGRQEAKLIVEYRGFVKMAMRSGQVRAVHADVVYEGDHFRYERGTGPFVQHTPTLTSAERGNLTHAYAIAWDNKDRVIDFAVMTVEEVEAIRNRSRASDEGPWVTDYTEMAKKTCVRRLFKLIPVAVTPQLAAALEAEDVWEAEAREVGPPAELSGRRARLLAKLTGEAPAGLAEETTNGTDDDLPDMPSVESEP
jgi:phage RecT family recombinase